MKLLLALLLAFTSVAVCQTVQTQYSGNPRQINAVLFYNDEVCFVLTGYFGSKDEARKFNPGVFVHSKKHNRWLKITKVSTEGGTFGNSYSNNPKDQEKLIMAAIGWDFAPLKDEKYAALPLQSNGLRTFPQDISYDPKSDAYRLGFMTDWDIPSVRTYLFFQRKDLLDAFDEQ